MDKVFSRIVEITQHPAAAASFASIMFAPGGLLSFSEALSRYKTVWNTFFPCDWSYRGMLMSWSLLGVRKTVFLYVSCMEKKIHGWDLYGERR